MKRVNTLIDGLVMSRQFKASLPQVLVTSNHKLRVRVKYVEERLRKTSQNGVWNSCEATGRTRNTATRFCVLFDTDAQKKMGFRFGHPLAKPRSIDNFTGKEHCHSLFKLYLLFARSTSESFGISPSRNTNFISSKTQGFGKVCNNEIPSTGVSRLT